MSRTNILAEVTSSAGKRVRCGVRLVRSRLLWVLSDGLVEGDRDGVPIGWLVRLMLGMTLH